jgi:transposase
MNEGTKPGAVDYRQARGAMLAQSKAKAFRHIAGDTYLVPSATASSGYVVDVTAGSCTCADYEERGVPCKHQWALRYFRHELEMPDGTTVVTEMIEAIRKTYAQDWGAYNRAQCEEKERVQILLRGLCDGIVSPKQGGPGRPRLPLGDAVYASALKVYTTVSGRRATTDIRACEERGLVERAPAYNSVFKIIERPDLRILFKVLVEESAAPLKAIERTFAADSTGFATNTYSRWFDHKYGEEKRQQRWVKLHAMVGTVTNVITAAEVTESNVGDSPMLAPVAERTKANGFDMREVSLDKAYLSHDNLALVEKLGGVPYVPFKVNSGSTGSAAWERMWHYFSFNRDDFFMRYHKRSNVESTFSAVKRKFGDGVRSKLPDAQFNEVLLKCLCHNLSMLTHAIHEFGIEPKFWMPQTAGGVS